MESEVSDFHRLEGRFNFHSIQNNTPVFVRDGGKVATFNPHPYYLIYNHDGWYIQDASFFDKKKVGGWTKLSTTGLFYCS